MMDANAVWEVEEAIACMRELAKYNPYWIEEPLSPDDILGHARLQREMDSWRGKAGFPENLHIHVATGEQCSNRVMHKQFLQEGAYKILQTDITRLGGISEYIVVALMAAKMNVKVCLHAGGVGLCNMAATVCIFDYINISPSLDGKMTEYIDHLQEHFVHDLVVKKGRYLAPTHIGLGLEMKEESLAKYEYPHGPYWSCEANKGRFYSNIEGRPLPPQMLSSSLPEQKSSDCGQRAISLSAFCLAGALVGGIVAFISRQCSSKD